MELCDYSACALRDLIAKREVSPVDLLKSCLRRIEKVNPSVNAIVALNEEVALTEAKAAEEKMMSGEILDPLHGLPIAVKDLNETQGLRTTFGSLQFKDYVPEADEPLIADIRRAGAVVFAKTNTPEFGAGANTINDVYGFTRNPFNLERSVAGSSGGSAAALACSMTPLANGSDLGGSLRTPAGFNGVVGFRPTPGLIGDTTKTFSWWPLSVEGPMGRSVGDAALLLSAMVGERPGDALSWPGERADFSFLEKRELSDLKVAFSGDLGFAPVDREVLDIFFGRIALLEGLFEVCEEKNPPLQEVDRIFETLRAVGFLAKNSESLANNPELLGPNVTANTILGLSLSALDVAGALKGQSENFRRFLKYMESYDLLICPVAATQPYPEGQLYPPIIGGKKMETYISWVALSYGITLVGHPAIVLPCGTDENGLPFGIQLVGRYGRDKDLLEIAGALEEALSKIDLCKRPLPDLSYLSSAELPKSKG